MEKEDKTKLLARNTFEEEYSRINFLMSKENTTVSFATLRAFSAIMIVLCHICHRFEFLEGVTWYLGGTFVDVFLLLSAYLMGLSFNRNSFKGKKFFSRRIKRLIPGYYVYLTLTFLLISIFIGIDKLNVKQVFGHYFFVNWFYIPARITDYPLPQLGHLWFMSCIVLSYIFVAIAAAFYVHLNSRNKKTFGFLYFFFGVIFSTLLVIKNKFFIYPCVAVWAFTIFYIYGRDIMGWVLKQNKSIPIIGLCIGNLAAIWLYVYGLKDHPVYVFWINLFNAVLWIVSTPIIFQFKKSNRIVMFISSISFEIYLIHHPLCLGTYSLFKYMSPLMAILSVFSISIFGGWLLSRITSLLLTGLDWVRRKIKDGYKHKDSYCK